MLSAFSGSNLSGRCLLRAFGHQTEPLLAARLGAEPRSKLWPPTTSKSPVLFAIQLHHLRGPARHAGEEAARGSRFTLQAVPPTTPRIHLFWQNLSVALSTRL